MGGAVGSGSRDVENSGLKSPPSWRVCLAIAFVVALIAGTIAWLSMAATGQAKDFTLPWTAAQHLLAGRDPYVAMKPTGVYPFNVPFYYPLPAAVLTVPFALVPATIAGVTFVAGSFGLTAFLLARNDIERLPILLGFPAVMAATLGQWSPLLVAATIAPVVQVVLPVKPTLGFAAFVSRPSRVGVIMSLAIVAVSFLIQPGWLFSWRDAVSSAWVSYQSPFRWGNGAGVILLAALIWWRDRDSRLLAAMALAPQLPLFYDQLLVHTVGRTRREVWLLVGAGWVGGLAWALQGTPAAGGERPATGLILATIYLPALVVVGWRNWGQARVG